MLAATSLLLASTGAHAAHSSHTASAPVRHHARAHAHRASLSLEEPGLRSSAAFILDATHSSVLYSRHADVAMPIASITKLLTTLVVEEAKQPMDEVIDITADDVAIGTQLTRGDLFHLALMSSENRAAHALARNYPGGLKAFMPAMNAKAQALGMSSSHFIEPTGLSSENVASPEDLSKLVMAASENATIREYSIDPGYDVRIGRRMVGFHNTNSLVSNPTWNIIVQKTGYISEAGRCLVMQTVIEGRTVVIVLLNSFGKRTRVADATRIRKWMEAKLLESASSAVAGKT
jgi:D-alanyl-D-alanine endopeptidase (penicillin-binding protein 7)